MGKRKSRAVRAPSEARRRALAARKAWETRRRRGRAKERERRRRSLAAKRGWETRRRLEKERAAREAEGRKRRARPKAEKPKKRKAPKAPPKRRAPPIEPPEPPERRPRPRPRKEKTESETALDYFKLVLHSTCGRLKDEDVTCTVRTHREGDGSVSAEIVVPVYARDPADVRRLLVTIEELDGWWHIPAPLLRKAWVSIIFRVDTASVKEGEDPKYKISLSRGTYNAPTNYHRLENAAYAFQIARDDILPGLVEMGRVIVAIIMRVRYMPDGEHPTRPRI